MHEFSEGPHKDGNSRKMPQNTFSNTFQFPVTLLSRRGRVQLADTHLLEPQRVRQPPGRLRLRVHVRSRMQRRLPAGAGHQTQRRGLETQLRPLCYLLLQGRACGHALPLHCSYYTVIDGSICGSGRCAFTAALSYPCARSFCPVERGHRKTRQNKRTLANSAHDLCSSTEGKPATVPPRPPLNQ